MSQDFSLAFAPLLPAPYLAALAVLGALALALAFLSRARGAWWRTLAVAMILLALANPVAIIEERRGLSDIGVVVVDESRSQTIGRRAELSNQALERIRAATAEMKDLELRVVRAGASSGVDSDGTRLFSALERALADVPRARLAGAMLITDGQVHDAPKAETVSKEVWNAPVHALLTGARGERDRRLVVEKVPTYAIVGKPQTMTIRVDDGGASEGTTRLMLRRDGGEPQNLRVPIGKSAEINFTLERAGTALFELAVEPGPNELTLENNRLVITVSGVRDRLRVLLVSGEPHPGERTWRALLKSDPAVDLVHFTILRPPEAQDFTPVNELSLIAFPIRELFEVKLNEFDLIIFDRYRRRDILAQIYLDNIVRWVRGGGALLLAVGPSISQQNSLFTSPLGAIMPAVPTGRVFEQPFKATITDLGKRHPVTAELPNITTDDPNWSRWFRHVDAEPRRGHPLLAGVNARPVLVLDRVGEGRVAQFQSDHIWLWARQYESGGPHAELLRRVAHWLMKEPELEENDLRGSVKAGRIEVIRRSLEQREVKVEVTSPSGERRSLDLQDIGAGRARGYLDATEQGVHHVHDGARSAVTVVGPLNPIEMSDVRTTDELLKPVLVASGGHVAWLADGLPDLRQTRPGRDAGGNAPGGRAWLGFRQNGDYVTTGVLQIPVLPAIVVFLLGLGALVAGWRREST